MLAGLGKNYQADRRPHLPLSRHYCKQRIFCILYSTLVSAPQSDPSLNMPFEFDWDVHKSFVVITQTGVLWDSSQYTQAPVGFLVAELSIDCEGFPYMSFI